MKVVLVEDEIAASENLSYLLKNIDSEIEIITVLESVSEGISYFSKNNEAELVFMDIHLADGISFEIFDKVSIDVPIVFTTAYDQYAIQAFKVNSLDYLLKPITEEDLTEALEKFKKRSGAPIDVNDQLKGVLSLLEASNKSYKSTYLIQKRDELIPVNVANIAYFYIEASIVKAVTFDKQEYVVNKKLEDIELELNPENFLRINRQFVVNKKSVSKLQFHFNGKLIANLEPEFHDRVLVSKLKASEVKAWLND